LPLFIQIQMQHIQFKRETDDDYEPNNHFKLEYIIYFDRYMLKNADKQRVIHEEVSPWYTELLKLRGQSHGLPSLTVSAHHTITTF
jgi:hypothetical protein